VKYGCWDSSKLSILLGFAESPIILSGELSTVLVGREEEPQGGIEFLCQLS
jgi:hypothetical protein